MNQRGFTLLEVVIALAVLGISLTVLLESQASSLNNAGRSRDMTVATLLARGKMIDIEKHLFHDGFQLNTEEEDGDFREDGQPEIKWKYRISEVELDLTALSSLCGNLGGGDKKSRAAKAAKAAKAAGGDAASGGGDCESMLSGVGSATGPFLEEIGRSLRVVDLKVTWPEGRYSQTMSVRALLSRDDFATEQVSDQTRLQNQLLQGQQPPGANPTGATTSPPPPPAGH